MSQALSTLHPNFPLNLEDLQKNLSIPKRRHIWDLELGALNVASDSEDNSKKTQKHPEGTQVEYISVEVLLADYRKLMLLSDLLNDWCSNRIVGVHFIGYCQFISDVFMMIQILRLTDFDVATVMWYECR